MLLGSQGWACFDCTKSGGTAEFLRLFFAGWDLLPAVVVSTPHESANDSYDIEAKSSEWQPLPEAPTMAQQQVALSRVADALFTSGLPPRAALELSFAWAAVHLPGLTETQSDEVIAAAGQRALAGGADAHG
jgi:hypothetical protein